MFYHRESLEVKLDQQDLVVHQRGREFFSKKQLANVIGQVIDGYGIPQNLLVSAHRYYTDTIERQRYIALLNAVQGQEATLRIQLRSEVNILFSDMPDLLNAVSLRVLLDRFCYHMANISVPRSPVRRGPQRSWRDVGSQVWPYTAVDIYRADAPMLYQYMALMIHDRWCAAVAIHEQNMAAYTKQYEFLCRPLSERLEHEIQQVGPFARLVLRSLKEPGDELVVERENGRSGGRSQDITALPAYLHAGRRFLKPASAQYALSRNFEPVVAFLGGNTVVKRSVPSTAFDPRRVLTLSDDDLQSLSIGLQYMHRKHQVWGWIEPSDIVFLPSGQMALKPGKYCYQESVIPGIARALDVFSLIWSLVGQTADTQLREEIMKYVLLHYPDQSMYLHLYRLCDGGYRDIPLKPLVLDAHADLKILKQIKSVIKKLLAR